jgi:hypothetical protein
MIMYDIISHDHKYLTILSPKLVACQVEGISSCLEPSAVELTLPLNAKDCQKLSSAAVAGDQVFFRMVFNSPAIHFETCAHAASLWVGVAADGVDLDLREW